MREVAKPEKSSESIVGHQYRRRQFAYIPIDRQGANLFFQLIRRRYERVAILLTSNQSLGAWGEDFGDAVIASAVLDRLLHHATTINIKGDSYRLREKRKAGLRHSTLTPHSEPSEFTGWGI